MHNTALEAFVCPARHQTCFDSECRVSQCSACNMATGRSAPDDGKVDKFKARLTIRGFNMRRGLNYLETHAPTMMHSSIRLLVAEAAARRAAGSTADLYGRNLAPSTIWSQ